MLKTKIEFQSDCLMSEEQSKRHEDYIKKHKPKGEIAYVYDYTKYISKSKKKGVKSVRENKKI